MQYIRGWDAICLVGLDRSYRIGWNWIGNDMIGLELFCPIDMFDNIG